MDNVAPILDARSRIPGRPKFMYASFPQPRTDVPIYDGRPSDEGVSAFGHCRATGFSRLGSTCRATMDRSGYAPGGARRA